MIGLAVFLLILAATLSTMWDYKAFQLFWKWFKE